MDCERDLVKVEFVLLVVKEVLNILNKVLFQKILREMKNEFYYFYNNLYQEWIFLLYVE